MILPSKHLSQDRALLTVGARLLSHLTQPKTVSTLWEEITQQSRERGTERPILRYDAYVLTLDLLFLIGAVEYHNGLLNRKAP